jgi:hypothetical protein
MELWSEPMTAKTAAFLLAALVALFGLIRLEMRRQARTSNVLSPVAQGAPLALGAEIRTVALLGLIATIFAAVGSLFGAAGAVVALAMAVVMAFWSFWHTGPAILAQCGARYVTDRNLIEAVQELAAKAGIPAPRVFPRARRQGSERIKGRRPTTGGTGGARPTLGFTNVAFDPRGHTLWATQEVPPKHREKDHPLTGLGTRIERGVEMTAAIRCDPTAIAASARRPDTVERRQDTVVRRRVAC